MPRDRTIRDHFGNAIEVGDRYFYGSPPTHGVVIKLRTSSLMLDIGACRWTGANATMNCKSPEKGICIDRVPADFWPGR